MPQQPSDITDANVGFHFRVKGHQTCSPRSSVSTLHNCVCVCVFSHAAGYDSDPSTPMVYSCSTQYHIHTHGVFRGLQVGQTSATTAALPLPHTHRHTHTRNGSTGRDTGSISECCKSLALMSVCQQQQQRISRPAFSPQTDLLRSFLLSFLLSFFRLWNLFHHSASSFSTPFSAPVHGNGLHTHTHTHERGLGNTQPFILIPPKI